MPNQLSGNGDYSKYFIELFVGAGGLSEGLI